VNINIKISRDFKLLFLIIICLPLNITRADLDKNFRENFSTITEKQCFNSIKYSVDDIVGFENTAEELYKWECVSGKCEEYKTLITCLFDDAFEQVVNVSNKKAKDYLNFKFSELRDTDINNKDKCVPLALKNIQEKQSNLGFKTDCLDGFSTQSYSACRVTETVLNEMCGYHNFLTAKINDYKSFHNEELGYTHVIVDKKEGSFEDKVAEYKKEIDKSKRAFLDTSALYNNFVHKYRVHTWITAIRLRLKYFKDKWLDVSNAIETFPGKFIDASSLE
jgi:hypothetical protein